MTRTREEPPCPGCAHTCDLASQLWHGVSPKTTHLGRREHLQQRGQAVKSPANYPVVPNETVVAGARLVRIVAVLWWGAAALLSAGETGPKEMSNAVV